MSFPADFPDRVGLLTLYRVSISAQKLGAIGAHGVETRHYEIETAQPSHINELAILRASREGLQHIKVTHVQRSRA